jgi:tetratricopeptide (TPR) repeat protein
MASIQVRRAQLLVQQGRFEDARKPLGEALAQDPEDVDALCLLSAVEKGLGNSQAAIKLARQAVHFHPDAPHAHNMLAHVQNGLGSYKLAEASAKESIRLDPYYAGTWATLAYAQFNQDHWKAALTSADRGLEQDAEDADCQRVRALALERLGKTGDAMQASKEHLAAHPDDAHAHASAGWLLLKSGNHRAALERFREALRLRSNFEWARTGLLSALRSQFAPYRWALWLHSRITRIPGASRYGVLFAILLVHLASTTGNKLLIVLSGVIFFGFLSLILFLALFQHLVNLTLCLHPIGRYALTRGEKIESWLVAGLCAVTFANVLTAALTNSDPAVAGAFTGCLILFVQLTLIRRLASQKDRLFVAGLVCGVGVATGGALFVVAIARIAGGR